MLVAVALLSVALAFLNLAFAFPNDAVAMLVAAAIVAGVVGFMVAALRRIERVEQRILLAVAFSALAGLVCSFFVIQFEWHGEPVPDVPEGEHPWPRQVVLYVVTAVVRCGLLGALIGLLAATILAVAGGDGRRVMKERRTLMRAGALLGAVAISWAPVTHWHLQEWSVRRLVAAVENARSDQIERRLALVAALQGERKAVGLVAHCAVGGRNDQVRLCALDALRMLRKAAMEARLYEPVLKELVQDESEPVRSAASEYLKEVGSP